MITRVGVARLTLLHFGYVDISFGGGFPTSFYAILHLNRCTISNRLVILPQPSRNALIEHRIQISLNRSFVPNGCKSTEEAEAVTFGVSLMVFLFYPALFPPLTLAYLRRLEYWPLLPSILRKPTTSLSRLALTLP